MKHAITFPSFDEYYQILQNKARHYKRRSETRALLEDILRYYKGLKASESYQDEDGVIWDCFEPESLKPELLDATAPSLPPGSVAEAEIESLHREFLKSSGTKRANGCVPIRRLTITTLRANRELSRLHKEHRSGSDKVWGTEAGSNRCYAVVYEYENNLGGMAFLSVHQPVVRHSQQYFSLCQLWVSAGQGNQAQVIEIGWQVCPKRTGHDKPVLFAYLTPNGYRQGYYDADPQVFVPYQNAHYRLGQPLSVTEIHLACLFDQGNWWLYVNSEPIGYYKSAALGSGPLSRGAKEFFAGGEVSSDGPWPAMGSGRPVDEGVGRAAHVRNANLATAPGNARPVAPTIYERGAGYQVHVLNQANWQTAFLYGGPGNA
ncbi:MAG: DUF239 domain-containing protein [Chitinophagaceae bacterium]|nr:MAG: DUF239 domain-containing protein [Chitinophagaceae bacterium]